jgi:hypothetical protein
VAGSTIMEEERSRTVECFSLEGMQWKTSFGKTIFLRNNAIGELLFSYQDFFTRGD